MDAIELGVTGSSGEKRGPAHLEGGADFREGCKKFFVHRGKLGGGFVYFLPTQKVGGG